MVSDVIECCDQPTVWHPDCVGTTCGGLKLRGAFCCSVCLKLYLGPASVVHEAGTWTIAKGGRSIETGSGRIRVDGAQDVEALMKRLMRLPELERENAKLRKAVEPPSE
jgi:hypothetical protein